MHAEAETESLRIQQQLQIENAALKQRLQLCKTPTSDDEATTCSSFERVLSYLATCPRHETLGVPLVDPMALMAWCEEVSAAVIMTLGRQIPPGCPRDSLQDLLIGNGVMDPEGPFEGGAAASFSRRQCEAMEMEHDAALQMRFNALQNNTAIRSLHNGVLSSWSQGNLTPILSRNVAYHANAPTSYWVACFMLVAAQMPRDPSAEASEDPLPPLGRERIRKLLTRDGHPRILLLLYGQPELELTDPRVFRGAMRDFMALSHVPAFVMICNEKGQVLSQNTFAMAHLGAVAEDQHPDGNHPDHKPINYLRELLGSQASVDSALLAVSQQGVYRGRVHITSPTLLSYMQLPPEAQLHQDVSISRLRDGVIKQTVYVIVQIDVTSVAAAEQRLEHLRQQQQHLLQSILPRQVINVLLDTDNKTEATSADSSLHGPATLPATQPAPRTESGQEVKLGLLDMNPGTLGSGSPKPGLVRWREELHDRQSPPLLLLDSASFHTNSEEEGELDTATNTLSMVSTTGGLHDLSTADVGRLSTYHEQVTVLFASVQGVNDLSKFMGAAQGMLFLNEVFSAFDALIDTHDVYKVETVGEVYMVCAGLFDRSSHRRHNTSDTATAVGSQASPKPDQDALGGHDPQHAHKMLGYAKAMLAAVAGIRTAQAQPVKLLLGIHSGPIMTGVVGTRMPRFCCFGDTVNTASRMQSTGTAGVIHASASFRDLTCDESWEPTGGVEVKGKGHMETYVLRYSPQ